MEMTMFNDLKIPEVRHWLDGKQWSRRRDEGAGL